MNSRYWLLGAVVLVLAVAGSMQLAQITGFTTTGGAAAGTQEIQVVINDGAKVSLYSVTLSQRETAFDALKRVATPDYRMRLPSVYITSINGIKEDSEHTWIFLVNEKMPEVGSDFYYPVGGDVVKFSYMTAEEAAEYLK